MWNNINDKKNPNSPDYKCKDKECDHAVWLTKKGDPSRKAAGKSSKPDGTQTVREQYWAAKAVRDEAETLILRRQSAQDKALKWIMVQVDIDRTNNKATGSYTPEDLRKLVEWFVNDAVQAGSGANEGWTTSVRKQEPATEEEVAADMEESLEI